MRRAYVGRESEDGMVVMVVAVVVLQTHSHARVAHNGTTECVSAYLHLHLKADMNGRVGGGVTFLIFALFS